MVSSYQLLPNVRVRFWLGAYEGDEGTYLGKNREGYAVVRLDNGQKVAEPYAHVEIVIS